MKALFASLLSVALVGCDGGSSSSDSDAPDDALAGSISGLVVDAVSSAPLNDVNVRLADDPTVSALTGSDGRFVLPVPGTTEPFDLSFARDDYREETYSDAFIGTLPAPGEIALVPNDNAGAGGLAGRLGDANGNAFVGATIRFLSGINTREGEAVASTTTAADGSWQVGDLAYGNYTCIILIDGLDPVYEAVQVFGNIDRTEQNVAIDRGESGASSSPPAVFEPVLPPEPNRDAFVAGQSSWSVPEHEWSAASGGYTVKNDRRTGLLSLGFRYSLVPNEDPLAGSTLSLEHSLAGNGSYRVVDSYEKLDAAARIGDKAVIVRFRTFDMLDFTRRSVVQYDGVEGEASQSLLASIDELGRYHFSTGSPILVRKGSRLSNEPEDAAPEYELTITEAFIP